MTRSLHVVAHIRSRPGQHLRLRAVLDSLVTGTRAEAGCRRYDLLTNLEDEADFVILEEWDDEAALAAHFETEHIRAARESFVTLVEGELDVRKYR